MRHAGATRRAGSGLYQPGERHEAALRRSRFEQIDFFSVRVRETWTVEQIIGHLFSTSYASRSVLGERVATRLADDLERELRLLDPAGTFEKTNEFTLVAGRRAEP